MSNIQERLDNLCTEIQRPNFLAGKGLSNEVNIRLFCYDPAEEIAVQHFLHRMMTEESLKCRLVERNLYHIFLELCEDMDILETIPEMEECDGSAFLLEQIHSAIGNEDFVEKMKYAPHEFGDVLLITGVGDVFPFMRVHILLEALQPHFSDIPILVMYPGEFDGYHLKLFGELPPSDYYRAFNLI